MRMRKKKNLVPRMEACGSCLVRDPFAMRGQWRTLMPQARELRVELGCGKGRFTADTAAAEPDVLLIAVEKVPDAMVVAMERVTEAGLKNVFFVDGDAALLPDMFASGEVDRLYINFCDPWPRATRKNGGSPTAISSSSTARCCLRADSSTSRPTTTSCSRGRWRKFPSSAFSCRRLPPISIGTARWAS